VIEEMLMPPHVRPHIRRTRGLFAVAAAALAAGASPAAAKEIEVDQVTISAGQSEGRSSFVPWSGVWWPFVDTELAKGWNGTAADFTYDANAKQWKRANESKPVNDRSPLLKYDEYVRLTTGTDPKSALLEVTGDDATDFMHNVYGDQKKKYDDEGISYGWWGHCNGWCGAALMEKEPIAPIEARGIRFEVADLKGLLSESFWGVESDFTGKRYNKPPKNILETREPGKQLYAALTSGHPKPVAEYIAWYEKAWNTKMTDAAKAAAKPEDFKDELELYDSWYKRTYDDAYADVSPDVWHKILLTVIGRKKMAFVADITANEEVWNHPAFAYRSSVTLGRTYTEGGAGRKEWSVATTVWYATDGVSESTLGVKDFTKNYTYTLVTDDAGRILLGTWTGASVDDHPDFAWLPTYNPTGRDDGENHNLLYGKILEILPASHATSEARAIDLTANGTRASTRRANDRTTTWDQPVAAGGDVALSVAVASGRSVTKVKYFEEPVNAGYSGVTASRSPLVSLGESTTGPDFAATARFASNGKKMVVAYAYDAGGRLVGYDEITLQYTIQGGSTGGGTGADDAFEENNTRAHARAIQAGSYPSLVCNDDDWYAIALAQAGSITVKIDFQHAEGDLDMTLEGAAGQLAKSDGTGNSEEVTRTGLAAGTYYVHVYGYNGARAKYAMTVTVAGGASGGGSAGDDLYEPNNDRGAAAAIQPGALSGLRCNDEDWYKVTVAAGTLAVKIDFRHAEGDLDLFVYDGSGAEIGRSEGTADGESVSKTVAAGTYYVRVIGYNGARAAYSLTVTATASGGTGGGATTRTGTVTASVLNVRSGPATTYGVVTTIRQGTAVTILATQGTWYRVTWDGAPAGNLWVSGSYVRLN
jgi:hypothetical protein